MYMCIAWMKDYLVPITELKPMLDLGDEALGNPSLDGVLELELKGPRVYRGSEVVELSSFVGGFVPAWCFML